MTRYRETQSEKFITFSRKQSFVCHFRYIRQENVKQTNEFWNVKKFAGNSMTKRIYEWSLFT